MASTCPGATTGPPWGSPGRRRPSSRPRAAPTPRGATQRSPCTRTDRCSTGAPSILGAARPQPTARSRRCVTPHRPGTRSSPTAPAWRARHRPQARSSSRSYARPPTAAPGCSCRTLTAAAAAPHQANCSTSAPSPRVRPGRRERGTRARPRRGACPCATPPRADHTGKRNRQRRSPVRERPTRSLNLDDLV